jgi:hypothetical protein
MQAGRYQYSPILHSSSTEGLNDNVGNILSRHTEGSKRAHVLSEVAGSQVGPRVQRVN